ncbi:HalOD1 output domain-containing protein [Halorarius litoreus]|uniref:HalOD1 output domain-containing protein n=1 Tax=Halorarius litoreus TaxID=2962676 RepID=UPI0020CD53EF|nr:HalOD1 output domain-containing protein [Halorarius litoreus]
MTDTSHRASDSGFTYQLSDSERVSSGVVQAVAAASGVSPIPDLSPTSGIGRADTITPLYSAIDPDALDALFTPDAPDRALPSGTVTFPYHGYAVTVRSDGTIHVEPADATSDVASD